MAFFSQGGHIFSQSGHVFHTNWSPSKLTGLVFWSNGDSKNITEESNTVYEWKDMSGLMNNAFQIYSLYRPSLQSNIINGYSALYFENNHTVNVSLSLNYFTVFSVVKSYDEDIIYQFGNNPNTETGFYLKGTNIYSPNTIIVNSSGTSMKNHTNDWLTAGGTWKILTQSYNGTHDTNKLYINSNKINLSTYSGYNGNPGSLSSTKTLYIGGNHNNTSGIRGYIAEYLVFNRELSNSERGTVLNYLNSKFQIY